MRAEGVGFQLEKRKDRAGGRGPSLFLRVAVLEDEARDKGDDARIGVGVLVIGRSIIVCVDR